MNSICNRAIVLSLLGSFGMLVGVSSEAGSLDSRQEVVSEMKCVKRILQHNIGGQEGYAFSKESIKKAIPLFHSKQTMSGVIQECAGFLKTHSDTGFDESGAALQSFAATKYAMDSHRPSGDPTDMILRKLLYPKVLCVGPDANAGIGLGDAGVGIDLKVSFCVTSDGIMFIRPAAGGGYGVFDEKAVGMGGTVTIGAGGGISEGSYVKVHDILSSIHNAILGVAWGVGGGVTQSSYSEPSGDDAAPKNMEGTVNVGVGILFDSIVGKDGTLRIPVGNYNRALYNSFVESL